MSPEEITSVVFTTIQCILFIIGVYLQIKMIFIEQDEKGLTWKCHIYLGAVMLIYYPSGIFMHSAAQFLHPLSDFTGVWLCYVASYLKIIGIFHIYGHSFITATSKYIFIVHRKEIAEFGRPKAQNLLFWFYVVFTWCLSISLIPNPTVIDVHPEYSACFRTAAEEEKKANLAYYLSCPFEPVKQNDLFMFFVYVTTECFCFLEAIILWVSFCNLPEAFLYYKIFQCIYR